jgi:hypothetical protein
MDIKRQAGMFGLDVEEKPDVINIIGQYFILRCENKEIMIDIRENKDICLEQLCEELAEMNALTVDLKEYCESI